MLLLQRIEDYLRASRISPARFGREAVGDPRFVFDLHNGRAPREATIARVNAYLDALEKPS